MRHTIARSLPLVAMLAGGPALAAPPITTEVPGTVEEMSAAIEDAIINAGLVLDGRHEIGGMLARTKDDVGGTRTLYTAAETLTLCSARVSRAVMEKDLRNIQFCPYSIFVYEAADKPGTVVIGHRDYGADGLPEINALLDPIIADAIR